MNVGVKRFQTNLADSIAAMVNAVCSCLRTRALMLALLVMLAGLGSHMDAADACCTVLVVNQQTTTVSAKVNSTGQLFQFKLTNPKLLGVLKPGQAVYANFQRKLVSLDGSHPAGTIVTAPNTPAGAAASSGTAASPLTPAAAAQINSEHRPGPLAGSTEACCEITAIDSTGLVVVKETATGRAFKLRMKDSRQLSLLKQGQSVNVAVSDSGTAQVHEQRSDTSAAANNRFAQIAATPSDRQLGAWFFQHGGAFHRSADPTRPAILLVHGLHGSAKAWMSPADDPGVSGYFYDFDHTPPQVREQSSTPNEGVFKVGTSAKSAAQINAANWFNFLAGQNFTVATWDQPGKNFQEAYSGTPVCEAPSQMDCPSAQHAYQQFLAITQRLNPSAPPPVVLVGHSRGGLIIRQLLKDEGSEGRVKWVITLHSPHTGSELAIAPEKLKTQVELLCSTPVVIEGLAPWSAAVSAMCYNSLESLIKDQLKPEQRELAPGGPVLGPLASGETKLPDVTYYTFGGTSPTLVRFYAWFLTPDSGVPQFKCDHSFPPNCEVYFKWVANASELPGISPMLGALPDHFVPEITPGKGDSLVADARSRLPFASTHVTDTLNHAEVLWDRNVQQQVANILNGVRVPPDLRPGRGSDSNRF